MKKLLTSLIAVFITLSTLLAQSPDKMSYQSVIRNANGELIKNRSVGMRISVLQASTTGTEVYSETQITTSNDNGLVSIQIGAGTVVIGDFPAIDWTDGPFYIKVETAPEGGTNYNLTGVSQLLSVPYALHAKTASSITGEIPESDPLFSESVANNISATDTSNWNNKISDYSEEDPFFSMSVANSITTADTTRWNNKLSDYAEEDPLFSESVSKSITTTDTTRWNNKLASYTETDPIYSSSVASEILSSDTSYWSNKQNTLIIGNGLVKNGDTVLVKSDFIYQPWDTVVNRDHLLFENKVTIGSPSNTDVPALTVHGTDMGPTSPTLRLSRSSARNNVLLFESADNGYAASVGLLGTNVFTSNFFGIGLYDGTSWANPLKIEFGASDNSVYINSNGNVGFATISPQRPVHIKDVLRLEPRDTAPLNPAEGDIYMDSVTHKLMVFDGTVWQGCW